MVHVLDDPEANSVQDVFLDYSVPLEVRYLAIIQLKNGIDKYWRKTATKYAWLPVWSVETNTWTVN